MDPGSGSKVQDAPSTQVPESTRGWARKISPISSPPPHCLRLWFFCSRRSELVVEFLEVVAPDMLVEWLVRKEWMSLQGWWRQVISGTLGRTSGAAE